jgi:type IV secretory pathway VirB10-like protein
MTADTDAEIQNGAQKQSLPDIGNIDIASVAGTAPGASGTRDAGSGNAGALPVAGTDAGTQAEKRAFLRQKGDTLGGNEDLAATLHGPKPNTIMEGTAIPAVMMGGMNSDMPGMVVGRVIASVYDSETGETLLIPQNSKLIGKYDDSVSNGQTRIGVVWNRIIFPDTTSIQIGAMEGADEGGYAGFNDLVDRHFWEKFGNAMLISIAGAGVQLLQPQAVNGQNFNSTQLVAGSMGQQFSELGQEYARAGMTVPNTLEIRPGYRFVVMVNKDIHLPPFEDYRDQRVGDASTGPVMQ